MEKAASTLRRSGVYLLSFGSDHKDLNLIITDLHCLKSQVKALRDGQQTVLSDILNWTSVEENRALQELFLHLSDLNSVWSEAQTQFADQVVEYKQQFNMILEGQEKVEAARHKLTECEENEAKALKKLQKSQKKKTAQEIAAAEAKLEEIKAQKELAQAQVTEKVRENEAVKLIRIKAGLLKLSEAYLRLSQKCRYIFEAQRDIVKCLPDVGEKEIQDIRFDGLSGAKEIIQRAQTLVKEYSVVQHSTSQQMNAEPPPPYTPNPIYETSPYNPYYTSPTQTPNGPPRTRTDGPSRLYPTMSPDEELAGPMNAAKI